MQRILPATALALCLTSSVLLAQTQQLIIPQALANVGGTGPTNVFPYGYVGTAWPGLRILYNYDSSHFTGATPPINYPILITGIRWRANDGTTSWTGGTHAQATLELSTAAVPYTAPDTTWANNHGVDRTIVHNGPLTILPGTGNGVGVPGPYFVDIQFPSTPFLYDPTSGSGLIIDSDTPLTGWGGGTSSAHDIADPTTAVASRVFGSSMYPAANGVTNDHAVVIEIDYNPASGLFAGFTSDVQTGPSPLAVQFTDNSYSSDPLGVLAWEWDFENDGTVDSTLQNPSHTYTACGTYDVSLRVTDAVHPQNTLVQTGFITTDTTEADFTHSIIGPLVVAFTDLSTGPATAWDWDLDGDGTTDSTAQNPAWAYTTANPVAVTLTTTRLCSAPSTITKTIVPVPCIETLYAGGNAGGAGWTMLFDCDVTNPQGIELTSIDANLNASTNPTETIDVYIGSDTYLGNEMNANHWQFVGTATGPSNGPGVPSPMTLSNSIYLPPGDYAIALHYSSGMPYTNGNGTNQMYSNGDLTLNLGISRSTTFGAPFGAGGVFNPRVWNGGFCYEIHSVSGGAGYGFGGSGCPSSQGITSNLSPSADPVLGTTITVDVTDMPDIGGGVTAGVLMSGFSNTTSPLGPLPFDLGGVGAPGCSLRVSPDITTFVAGINNTATWTLVIPNDPGLAGVLWFQQAVVLDPGFNAAGAVGSHAAGMLFGN